MIQVFLILGAIGFAVVLMVLIFGDLLDGIFRIDALSGLDSDLLSTAGIAGLIAGFGFGGALGLAISNLIWVAILIGLVVGVILGLVAGKAANSLRKNESGNALENHNLIGVEGRVTAAIPAGGCGQIQINHAGHQMTVNAKSEIPLAVGTAVLISGVVSGNYVQVTPVEELPAS